MKTFQDCIERPGIIPNVMGGIGNQMFIVAAAYVASKQNNIPLYILQNPLNHYIANMHNQLKQNYNASIFNHFGEHCVCNLTDIEYFKHHGYRVHNPKGFMSWNPNEIVPGTILNSYYQYWPVLQAYEEELRELFLKGIQIHIDKIFSQYSFEDAAFLHIRRGDYLKLPEFHYVQTIEDYYKPAYEKLKELTNVDKIYVLSDDKEWAKSQPFFSNNSIFTIVDIPNELDAMAFMSKCTAGAIIGNSTFSWWGAFLGAYANRSPVIVPKRWIAEPIVCLFPNEWQII